MSEETPPAARAAATVMLLRERDRIEVYLARRAARSRFMPGAYVFPGGAVDAADRAQASLEQSVGASESAPLAIAAVRELFEEAGVLLVCDAGGAPITPPPGVRAALRAELRGGADFAAALRPAGLRIDLRGLIYYSRWITPIQEPIRFDTHFFLATVPSDQEPEADAHELHDGMWCAPAEALRRADSGELTIFFPTRMHLERLAAFADLPALFEHARARTIAPLLIRRLDDGVFALPDGTSDW